jgi:uncharacterized DUF497 family protein
MGVQFQWERRKAASNLRKHGVRLTEASTVFRDPLAVIFDDEAHSVQEAREIIVGHSANDRLLVVCFTEREENLVRIISACLATSREREDYEENRDF